jgi:hypothetical protein
MSNTITVRLGPELAAWLEATARRRGVSQGEIIREQLQVARAARGTKPFMAHAGAVSGARNLSQRKGFSRK